MADTKLNIIITAQDKTGGALKGVANTLGGIGKFAAGAAIAGIGAAVTAVAGLGAGIIALSKDAAGLAAVSESFAGFTSSIGVSSNEMLKSLQDASNGMVNNQDLMISFNKAAQLVSVDFAERLPDAMEYLGKVAGATGQDVGYLLDSLVTGVGRMSPLILDNLGIQVDMTAAQEEYAASIGKTVSELTKQEQQTALMNQVLTKLQTNTENLPDMVDPFKQLSVTMTNLKNSFAQALGPVVLPLITRLAESISAFVSSDEFQAWLANAVEWLQTKLVPALMKIVEFLTTYIPPAIQFLAAVWNGVLLPALTAVWEFLQNYIFPIFQSIISFFQNDVPAATGALKAAWEADFLGIRSIFEGLWNHIKLLFEMFKAMWEGDWRRVGEIARQMVDNLGQTLKNLFIGIWNTIKNIDWIELGKAIIRGIGEGIKALGQWFIDTLVDIVAGAVDFIRGLLGIQSPSKVFEEIGKNMMKGWSIGIDANMNQPSGSLARATNAMGPALAMSPVPAAGGAPTIVINYSPGMSLGNRREFEQAFVPIVDRALRQVSRGRS